jgi:MoxR-like ATPase
VMDGDMILSLRKTLDKVVVADPVRDYSVRLVLATHPDSEVATEKVRKYVRWGASPRAAQAMIRAGRVRALAEGRAHIAFADVRYFADEVFGHRVLLNYDGQAENIDVLALCRELVQQVPEEV